MKLQYVFMLFIAVVIAQLFVPAQMILGQEIVLETGKAYKFKTQPVDPSDPYRGKYITLRYDMNSALNNGLTWERNEAIYVYIKEDSLGFAELVEVSKSPTNSEHDYVIAEARRSYKDYNRVFFDLPFNRFYMNETKAKPAEDAYREAQRDTIPNNTYALVYVKDGEAVLSDVIINEVPIADYVEE